MNWVDFFIVVVLIVSIALGVKNGLFRGIATLFGLCAATVFSVNHADWVARQLEGLFNMSPSIRFVFSFVLIFAFAMVLLKIFGYYYYKMAKVTPLKYPDKVGGGIMGALKGVIALSLIFIMFIFFPAFQSFNDAIDQSVMAPAIRQVVPSVFEVSSPLHPNSGPFYSKITEGILGSQATEYSTRPEQLLKRQDEVAYTTKDQAVIDNLDKYFKNKVELAKKDAGK